MNQQNKTERWEMEKIKNIVHRIYMDEDLMSGAREIKQLLSDARREVLQEVMECLPNRKKIDFDYGNQVVPRFENGKDLWGEEYAKWNNDKVNSFNEALDQISQSINKIKSR